MPVHYFNGPTAVPATVSSGSATHAPLGIFIAPAKYLYSGTVYDCTAPGLYKFWHPVTASDGSIPQVSNRIVAGVNDAVALASAAAWLVSFGKGDDTKPVSDVTVKARHSRVHMGCGWTAIWLEGIAESIGIEARLAHVLTAQTPNGYSDGHTIVEMKVGGAWKAFDASLGYVFRDPAGNLLNIADAVLGLWAGTTVLDRIAPFKVSSEVTRINDVPQGFDPASWIDANNLHTEAGVQAAARRFYQMPFLNTGAAIIGFTPPGTEGRAGYATGLGYQVVSEAAFRAQFYP